MKAVARIRTVVELITATTTTTGLTTQCAYDPDWYPTGMKITDADYTTIALPPTNGTATGTTPSLKQARSEHLA